MAVSHKFTSASYKKFKWCVSKQKLVSIYDLHYERQHYRYAYTVRSRNSHTDITLAEAIKLTGEWRSKQCDNG